MLLPLLDFEILMVPTRNVAFSYKREVQVPEFRPRVRYLLSVGLLLGCVASAIAAPAQGSEDDAAMAAQLNAYLAKSFVLSKELKLDPILRAEADKISAAHLARIKQLIPAWVQEERRLHTGADSKAQSAEVFYAVWARLLNELAFWQIEPGDAAYEQATLHVLKSSPFVCRTKSDTRFEDYASRVARLQAMPVAQRQAALDTERLLLERWGKPRAVPPPWPNPLPQDAAMAAIAQIRDGGARPPLALWPSLASSLLATRASYKDQPQEGKCSLQQWWLTVSLAQGGTPAAVLSAFRYGMLITVDNRVGRAFDTEEPQASAVQPGATPVFPKLAVRFDASGSTRIRRQLDAAGKPVQASVVDRKITVPGIRGARPIAFETIFDEAALSYALNGGPAVKPGKANFQQFELVWKMDPPETATKGDTQSRGATP